MLLGAVHGAEQYDGDLHRNESNIVTQSTSQLSLFRNVQIMV